MLKENTMYTVTKIEEQKKDITRSSVFINGIFDFGASSKAIKRYGLEVNMTLNEEEYNRLLDTVQLDKAKYRALDYMASAHKTEKQVREKLIKAEYSESVVEKVIEFLKSYKYLDDDIFAKRYMESKLTYGKKSAKQIQSILYTKGITGINSHEICENVEELEAENIAYFLNKYRYDPEMEYTEKRKIIGKIIGRGFNYTLVEKVIRKLYESFDE